MLKTRKRCEIEHLEMCIFLVFFFLFKLIILFDIIFHFLDYISIVVQPEVQVLNKILKHDFGKETILQCEISASPQAIVNWRKGDHIFTANSYRGITPEIYDKNIYITVLQLRIQNITWSDFGEYICEASNRLGKDQETMQLIRKITANI